MPDAQVYLLQGEEDLLIDQALAALLDRLMPAEERDLNLDVLRAGEIALPDLVTRLDTLPFFGRRRVVVVKDPDAWKAPEQERLAAYLEQGPPPSALILVAQGLDRRRKLYTTIRRIGQVQEFPRMSVRQLPSWIAERARQAGSPWRCCRRCSACLHLSSAGSPNRRRTSRRCPSRASSPACWRPTGPSKAQGIPSWRWRCSLPTCACPQANKRERGNGGSRERDDNCRTRQRDS